MRSERIIFEQDRASLYEFQNHLLHRQFEITQLAQGNQKTPLTVTTDFKKKSEKSTKKKKKSSANSQKNRKVTFFFIFSVRPV